MASIFRQSLNQWKIFKNIGKAWKMCIKVTKFFEVIEGKLQISVDLWPWLLFEYK